MVTIKALNHQCYIGKSLVAQLVGIFKTSKVQIPLPLDYRIKK